MELNFDKGKGEKIDFLESHDVMFLSLAMQGAGLLQLVAWADGVGRQTVQHLQEH